MGAQWAGVEAASRGRRRLQSLRAVAGELSGEPWGSDSHGKAIGNVKHDGGEAKSKKSEENQVLPASPSLGKNGGWELLVVTKRWRRRRGVLFIEEEIR
jgi:hypothetical protein